MSSSYVNGLAISSAFLNGEHTLGYFNGVKIWGGGPEPGPVPKQVYELVYPVGSYYMSMSDTFDPNVAFVGTWVQDTQGRMTMNSSDSTQLGTTGGEKAHELTESEVPGHTHSASGITFQTAKNGSFGNTRQTSYWNMSRGNALKKERIYDGTLTPNYAGSGIEHNNLQPYIVCVRWHRIA